ncbi:DUF1345 domain-containing protein [Methylocystis echinoides]|jgi:uncharacterized membrane protein|uniref:DUF1345 domain-containing protein n=1 Tax=Methylocystis echinoides TaxID=29468 RepID=UPI00341C9D2F
MSGTQAKDDKRRSQLLAPLRVLRAHYRLAVCGVAGVVIGWALPATIDRTALAFEWIPMELSAVTRGLIGWNAAVVMYLFAAARIIMRSTHASIRRRAILSDEGRTAVLLLTGTATFVAIGAILAELGQSKNIFEDEKIAHIGLAIVTVFSSWAFMHLIFAFHYAHEFYSDAAAAPRAATTRGGLRFPSTQTPQYIDFLYFSYVIGVACQTADVEICSRSMRAVALVHGVVAFFFNTTILALMVNISSQFV